MLTQEQIEKAQTDARAKLDKEAHESAVSEELKSLKAARAHLLPFKIAFQWPVRFDPWYKPNHACCKKS